MPMEIPLILSKLAPSILSSIWKYGLKKFIEEPFLSRAIRATADRYPDIDGLYYSLRDWCVTDSFKEILQEFYQGNKIADEDIVASFIDSGGFYDGECTEQRAKDIIKTFADELFESLSFSEPSQGAALHDKKMEEGLLEIKELLLQKRPEETKDKGVLLDAKFIRSLSQDDLDFFLTNIFIYHTGRKDVFCYVSKKDEWDALINKFKDYFDFREDKGTYYAHLKDGYAYTILSLIKSNAHASKRLVEFFAHLLFDDKPHQLHTMLLISFKTMILNLKLLPAEINSLLDQLIKKAEGIDSYNHYAGNIIVNMAIALLENIKEIDEQGTEYLGKFLMTKDGILNGSIGSMAIKYFNSLPSNMQEILFSFLTTEPYENKISITSVFRYPDHVMRADVIRSFMDIYLELPTVYKKRFDEEIEKIKYEENVYIKKELATYLLAYKSADFKFYSLLDYFLVDDNTISQVVGMTGLCFLETKGKDKYEYILSKIKEIKDENLRYQNLVANYFALDERDRGMVEEHVKKHPDAYNAQRFANIIGEHINSDNEDYMMTLDKFVALSKAESKATVIGVILGIVFNCRNIPRSTREEILYRYADTEDYNIREQIIRAVLENWAQFSDAIHEVVFEIIKKIDYRGCYLKHNYEAITEPFKTGLKSYLAPQEEMVK